MVPVRWSPAAPPRLAAVQMCPKALPFQLLGFFPSFTFCLLLAADVYSSCKVAVGNFKQFQATVPMWPADVGQEPLHPGTLIGGEAVGCNPIGEGHTSIGCLIFKPPRLTITTGVKFFSFTVLGCIILISPTLIPF